MNAPSNTELLFATADRTLLAPYGLDASSLGQVFGRILAHRVDYADLYFQYSRSESWSLEEGIVKSGSFSIDQGVGVRAVSGEKTAFAYSDDISLPALRSAADATRAIALHGADGRVQVARRSEPLALYQPHDPLDESGRPGQGRVARAHRALCARPRSARHSGDGEPGGGIRGGAGGALRRHDGGRCAAAGALVGAGDRRAGRASRAGLGGRRRAFRLRLFHRAKCSRITRTRRSIRRWSISRARPAPAGTMTVVLGPGWPGVLLHEAIGHGLEGDFNRKGTSAFSGRIGERVAAPGVTVVDDGTLHRRRGSLNVDDEGNPTQCTVLIEDGVLKGYMQDALNARLMGAAPTGNGRRESFAHAPMPRMTNTYMLSGDKDPARNPRLGQARPVRQELRRRPGRYRQRQVRVLRLRGLHDRGRQGHLSGQGRDADRQRSRRAHARDA